VSKKIAKIVKMELPGGEAKPGPKLASAGVNMAKFCTDFNAKTADRRGELVPVDDIVSEHINALVGAAPETFDTLEELAKWVTEHDEAIDIASTLTRLSKVETSLFDVDTGLVNRVGDIELILNGEGATQGLVAQTAKLISDMIIANNNILDLQDITETHGDKIEEIFNMLKWQILYDDGV
jgi:hypothetical protein